MMCLEETVSVSVSTDLQFPRSTGGGREKNESKLVVQKVYQESFDLVQEISTWYYGTFLRSRDLSVCDS